MQRASKQRDVADKEERGLGITGMPIVCGNTCINSYVPIIKRVLGIKKAESTAEQFIIIISRSVFIWDLVAAGPDWTETSIRTTSLVMGILPSSIVCAPSYSVVHNSLKLIILLPQSANMALQVYSFVSSHSILFACYSMNVRG